MTDAAKWIGYLEHRDERLLGIPDANTGKGGYTIFGAITGLQGLPWCVSFVFAVINRPDVLGPPCAGVNALRRRMLLRGLWRGRHYRPRENDLIFCRHKGALGHVGIVEGCDGKTVSSIDGNTVDPSGRFPPDAGGAVARRVRRLDDKAIVGYAATGKLLRGEKIKEDTL